MTPTDNLEPCRRCGQREVEVSSNEGWFMVECQNCPQRTSNANRSAADAIAEWNRRTPTVNLEAGAGDLVATGDWHMEAVYEQIEELQQAAKQTDSEPMEALFSDAADMALWLLRRTEEAQADAYRSSLLAVARLGELDKANERANKNWRDFRDLRLEIIGDGPMCRDCADENGRCPHSGQPCDPDEAVKEQIATWKAAEAQLKAAREHIEQLSELLKIIKEYWIDYDQIYSISVHEADEFCAVLSQEAPK